MSIYNWMVSRVEWLKSQASLETIKTHTFYTKIINSESNVIDLGANVGQFAHEMVKIFGCSCYAVEAVPDVYSKINEGELIKKFNLAISDENKPFTMYISNNRECNSLSKEAAATYGVQKDITVQGITFESFLDQCSLKDKNIELLKIDIEGGEQAMFNSISDETLSLIKQITIEFHDFVPGLYDRDYVESIVKRLKNLGFFCIPFSYIFPSADTCDFWFINTKLCTIPFQDWLAFSGIKSLLIIERFKSSSLHETAKILEKWI
jgi:FkbM family methyltransferase